MCRRAHGAAFVTWVSAPADQLKVDDPQQQLVGYASSPGALRQFCRRCGSSLFFRAERWPGEVHVARANVDGPLDRAPQMHGYYDTHVDWFSVNDDLPKKPPPAG